MIFYFLNLFFIFFWAIFIKDKKRYVFVVSLQMFLILALRNSTLGVDLENYNLGYQYISHLNFFDMISRLHFFNVAKLIYPFDYESGYVLLNWIVSIFNFNFHGLLVVIAFINMTIIGFFIYKYSKVPCLSFFIFSTFGIYSYFFGIIRQSLALCFFLLSIHYFIENKKNKSIFYFLLSFLFHRSIIITIPIYFIINNNEIRKNKIFVLYIFSLVVLLLSPFIYNNIVVAIMSLLGKNYLGHGLVLNNLIILIYIIAFLLIAFIQTNMSKEDKIVKISLYMLIFSIYVEIIGLYNDNFARIMQVFNVFLIISIPEVINQYKKQKSIMFVVVTMIVALILFYGYSLNDSVIVPYNIETGNFVLR